MLNTGLHMEKENGRRLPMACCKAQTAAERSMWKVLIADDEPKIRQGLKVYWRK